MNTHGLYRSCERANITKYYYNHDDNNNNYIVYIKNNNKKAFIQIYIYIIYYVARSIFLYILIIMLYSNFDV